MAHHLTTPQSADLTLELERASAAITLSDMELFVFPELLYSIVLANIMSPRIWAWRQDSWFSGIESMSPYKRVLRLKQYIMDHYVFNLDLETWGLTTKEREVARFRSFIDPDVLKQSNALFGYEGDKYYFDVSIRKHFGLDAYADNTIPYWKTETVEAMDAFRYKEGFQTGAGECVSLATLYAAALFIVARIPLEQIYLMATPLHSQNFIDVQGGILTNNRRIVTKNMWVNGTEISAKARRALENERVTIVAHSSGVMHTLYPEATIDRTAYEAFTTKLTAFVQTPLTAEILGNFLRYRTDLQKCFQVRWNIHGTDHYIEAERIFSYEQGSPYLFTSNNRPLFMRDIDSDEFHSSPLASRVIFNDLETYLEREKPDVTNRDHIERFRAHFECSCLNAAAAMEALCAFCRVEPRVPTASTKTFTTRVTPIALTTDMDRTAVMHYVTEHRTTNLMVALAWHAYRDVITTDIHPFLLAAFTRNPVIIAATASLSLEETINAVQSLRDESIYPEPGRLAQPDEVWNYRRGDGIEKALALALVLHTRTGRPASVTVTPTTVTVTNGIHTINLPTRKDIPPQTWTTATYGGQT